MLDVLIFSWYIMRRQNFLGKLSKYPMENKNLTPFKCTTHCRQVLIFFAFWSLDFTSVYFRYMDSYTFFLISQERCSVASTAEWGSDMNEYSSPYRHRSCPYPYLAPVREVQSGIFESDLLRFVIVVFTYMHNICSFVLCF